MALQYSTIPIQDMGSGVDRLSAENSIKEGFLENALNADPKPNNDIAKRKGYQGFAGYVPLRVTKVEYNSDPARNIALFFDSAVDVSSIDFSRIRNTPLIIQGKVSKANTTNAGVFKTNTNVVQYFPQFESSIKRIFSTGLNTLVITQEEHGYTDPTLFVSVYESLNALNNNSSLILADVSINKTTYDITITYNNGTGNIMPVFIVIENKKATSGSSYITNKITVAGASTSTTVIPSATHQLSNLNIRVRVFEDNGTSLVETIPNAIYIDSLNGDVTIKIDNSSGTSLEFYGVLTTSPIANVATGTVAANTTLTIPLIDLADDFVTVKCYLENTVDNRLEEVIAGSLVTDTDNRTAEVTFINSGPTSCNFYIYYDTHSIVANKLVVTGPQIDALEAYVDEFPQLTVYGLSHEVLYGASPDAPRPGWVNHIDTYKAAGENYVVAGLGGNLFKSARRADGNNAEDYLLPKLYPNIISRVAANFVVGPAFLPTGTTTTRTRGYITGDDIEDNLVRVEQITYDALSGLTHYLVRIPNLQIQGTLSTIIASGDDDADYVTLTQCGYKENEGTFQIMELTQEDADLLLFKVDNTTRSDDSFDESNSGGLLGVFTDHIRVLDLNHNFIVGDTLTSELFGSRIIKVQSIKEDTLVLSAFTEQEEIPFGLRVAGTRIGSVLPLRLMDTTSSVYGVVAGDMLHISDYKRLIRAKRIVVGASRRVDIVSNGVQATLTFLEGNTTNFYLGQKILLKDVPARLLKEHTIVEIVDEFKMKINTDWAGAVVGKVTGNCVELDETTTLRDTVNSTVSVEVETRFATIEIPISKGNILPTTKVFHFSAYPYADQAFIQSTMVNDNLYLTNGADEVLKFDGQDIYRAGLPRWQTQLFVTKDTSPANGGTIIVPKKETGTITAVTNPVTKFTVPLGDQNLFTPGQQVEHSENNAIYTVTAVDKQENDTTAEGYVYVDRDISGAASGNLRQVRFVRYYFRIQAVDKNGNLIVAAATGVEDFRVDISTSTQIKLRMIGFPAWDMYDYDRLEIEIYRTSILPLPPVGDQPAPIVFYRLTTLEIPFNDNQGYIDFIDATSDDTFAYSDNLDVVSSLFEGQEIGTRWNQPLRAKCITTANNALILGNLRSYPELDIRFIDTGVARITPALVEGGIITLRKDNTDVGVLTNMTDRALYQFVSTGANVLTIDPATDVAVVAGVVTVTSTAHGLSSGDWIYNFHAAVTDGADPRLSGWYQIEVIDVDTFVFKIASTITFTTSADDVDSIAFAAPGMIPVWMGTDGNYQNRTGNRTTPGDKNIIDPSGANEYILVNRLANAINSSMRMVDYSQIPDFVPWVIAHAGGEYSLGQIVLTQPKNTTTFFEVEFWNYNSFKIYANDIYREPLSSASARINEHPSRVIVSYSNYPELFDGPNLSDTKSVIDINPADGQEVTACIPFYGASSFNSAQNNSVVVVFKTNSIYILDVTTLQYQKIESRGLGCNMPRSVTVTKDGIMFANSSGVYRLNTQMGVDEQGRYMFRDWRDLISKEQLDLPCGHNYPKDRLYKLGVALNSSPTKNSNVVVYNSSREYTSELGSWTYYDNHPSTGWANLNDTAFMASTRGQVFSIRTLNDNSDYRDDDKAINFDVLLRAMDFGDSGIRKAILNVLVQYRVVGLFKSTKFYSAAELSKEFVEADQLLIENEESIYMDRKVLTAKYSINRRKGVFIQFRIVNSGYDEPVEVTKIDVRVGGLTSAGVADVAAMK